MRIYLHQTIQRTFVCHQYDDEYLYNRGRIHINPVYQTPLIMTPIITIIISHSMHL